MDEFVEVATVDTFLARLSSLFALRIVAGIVEPFVFEAHMCDPDIEIGVYRFDIVAVDKLRFYFFHIPAKFSIDRLIVSPSFRNRLILFLHILALQTIEPVAFREGDFGAEDGAEGEGIAIAVKLEMLEQDSLIHPHRIYV